MLHSELKIGNYIKDHKGEVRVVKEVTVDSQMCGFFPVVRTSVGYHDVSSLQPVEITSEWLEKFGFNEKQMWKSNFGYDLCKAGSEAYLMKLHGVDYYILTKEDDCSDGTSYFVNYIHELQNLYKDLTGEYLE